MASPINPTGHATPYVDQGPTAVQESKTRDDLAHDESHWSGITQSGYVDPISKA